MFGHGLKCISNNATYTVVFDNKRNRQDLTYLSRQFCPGTGSFLQAAMNEVSKRPYQYLLLDSSPLIYYKFRVRNFVYCRSNSLIFTPNDVPNCEK
jgi:hypothetical protein